MRSFFAGALALFAILYLLAESTLQREADDGVIRIRWATDPNPARNLQVEIFGKLQVRLKDEDVLDWPAFRKALAGSAEQTNGAVQRLRRLLGPQVTAAADRRMVLRAVNELLEERDLFAEGSLPGLEVSGDARVLLEKPPEDRTKVEVVALNRRILEAALPGLIRKAVRIEASVESSAREKLTVQCATGVGPDVIDVYSQAQMITYADFGILLDLTPYALKMGFAPENTYPAIKGTLIADGRQVRFPCNVWANCVIYNREVFDDHGLAWPDPNWTFDDFVSAGRRIVSRPGRSGTRHIGVANYSQNWMLNDLLVGCGGWYFTRDGLRCRLGEPEGVDAMRRYHDLMHVHKILPTPAEAQAMSSQGGWGTGGINWFSNGRAAMIFIGRWYLCQLPNYPDLHGKLGVTRLPRIGGRPSVGVCDTRAAGVNITSPNRDAALKFIQYLATPDYGQVIVNDGDSLPPNPALARRGEDLVNSVAPDPAFHQPFIDALKHARPRVLSPFIDGAQVDRWVT
ncbi:MAG: extracellular solute-binding protein, partial [Phycisphaerae bacterium]